MSLLNVSSLEEIKSLLLAGKTYAEISKLLQERSPSSRGLSAASIRVFCKTQNIGKHSLRSKSEVDRMVFNGISEVILFRFAFFA